MNKETFILRIVVASPLRQSFDYLPPAGISHQQCQIGMRVLVPFGRRKMVGMIIEISNQSQIAHDKLKSAISLIDNKPLLNKNILKLCQWASHYYHYPVGEIYMGTLPKLLRQGKNASINATHYWKITQNGLKDIDQLKRATKQHALLKCLMQDTLTLTQIESQGFRRNILTALQNKKYAEEIAVLTPIQPFNYANSQPHLALNKEQQVAYATISQSSSFKVYLLDGITGSGKTEVYLQCIDHLLKQNKQALILVPEISLTPQTAARFKHRFNVPVIIMHSNLSDTERKNAWLQAAHGAAGIIIGTRSTIFVPLKNPGIIILDEEHDPSFKQQSGFRYSARDLAVIRGQLENIPIILGSATPSLESLHNVTRTRYTHFHLKQRAGDAKLPTINLIDLKNKKLEAGLSDTLIQKIREHLANHSQVMLFLNRRGFSPILMCHVCGWIAKCKHCDARMTLHSNPRRLHCHHCDHEQHAPQTCEHCKQAELVMLGQGTQRLEQTLTRYFPDKKIVRIDRDATERKGSLQQLLNEAHNGADILIGTQMLAKGHHFPNLTLVVIVEADGGLFSVDFRALERMAQLLVQVSGRAGRADKSGEVFIQSHHPDHPLLQTLLKQGYHAFCKEILKEREIAQLPPYAYLALLRAEAEDEALPLQFLQQAKKLLIENNSTNVAILGPVPAPMERRAGRTRAQLLLQSSNRQDLQKALEPLAKTLAKCKDAKRVRYSLDVDPQEMY